VIHKIVSEMTYNVLSGMLNPTIPTYVYLLLHCISKCCFFILLNNFVKYDFISTILVDRILRILGSSNCELVNCIGRRSPHCLVNWFHLQFVKGI